MKTYNIPTFTVVLFVACFNFSCALQSAKSGEFFKTEIYFGMVTAEGGAISEQQWAAFLRREITPRFPQGLTVVSATGQWQAQDGKIVKEPAKIVILVHKNSTEARNAIDQIRNIYQKQFHQESVLRVTYPVEARF